MTLTDLIPHRSQVRTWPSSTTVNAVPGHVERDVARYFDIEVVLWDVDQHQWLVRRPASGDCLTRAGTWEHEPADMFKDRRWLGEHLLDLPGAMKLAHDAAPNVLWHGIRAEDIR